MKNKKVIVINSISRSGSNILWNIFQSHPLVSSPILETGQILFPFRSVRLRKISRQLLISSGRLPVVRRCVGEMLDDRMYKYKTMNMDFSGNREKSDGILYTEEEIKGSVLCMKSLNDDVLLTQLLDSIYEEVSFIGLVRDGYAVCEGWIRRGTPPEVAANLYRRICGKMIEDSRKMANYRIVKFEDIIRDPFGWANRLFSFAGLIPETLEKLRLKSKKILKSDGAHQTEFGSENEKYWFDENSIRQALDPEISMRQKRSLSPSDHHVIGSICGDILNLFDYSEK